MANAIIKAPRIAATMLGVLTRDTVLARLVWRDAGGNFAGSKDDTITVRVPAFMNARERVMRTGGAITVDEMAETSVPVTLNTNLYKAIGVSLEELTLDVTDFERQVAIPAVESVGRLLEDKLATTMSGATYHANNTLTINAADPYLTLVTARTRLNKARVPASERFLAVGADAEEAILSSDRLSKVNTAGNDDALRDAMIGRIAGFTAVSVPGLDPDLMIAAHRTAFVLSTQAPVVPQGAVTGASRAYEGVGLTAIQDYDQINLKDRFVVHTFMGTNVTADAVTIDAEGLAVPIETPATDGSDKIVVRAVKMTLA